ncbi:hypothetical protein PQX77_014762 [Marasmius sp. AFHP31]|nr:hypothetical protein PQX77_014762 [Marasmius sp. AFHP31]
MPLHVAIRLTAKHAAEKYYRGILGYRLLDLLAALEGKHEQPFIIPRTLFHPTLPNMPRFKSLSNYTLSIRKLNAAVLQESSSWPTLPNWPENVMDELWQMYLVTWQYSTMEKHSKTALLHNVLKSLSVIAFVISFFKMGHGDFPSDRDAIRDALNKQVSSQSV